MTRLPSARPPPPPSPRRRATAPWLGALAIATSLGGCTKSCDPADARADDDEALVAPSDAAPSAASAPDLAERARREITAESYEAELEAIERELEH